MFGFGRGPRWFHITVWLVAGCNLVQSAPPVPTSAPLPPHAPTLPGYSLALTLAPGMEWRFHPLVVDVNGDGHLDLILLGFKTAGLEVYLGDGTGNWRLHTTLPETRPGPIMPGRAVVLGDLDHDGHLDVVAAFQRWGVFIYYGDGRG